MTGGPTIRARAISVAVVGLTAAAGVWTFANLSVTTEITHFIPSGEDRELARIAAEMATSDLTRTITLTVEGPDRASSIGAARELSSRLAQRAEIASVRAGVGEDLERAFYELYFERRLALLARSPEDVEALTSDAGLRAAARDLRQRLSSPTGAFVRTIAPRDPLLGFVRHLERLREAQEGSLGVEGGQLVTEDGRGVVFVTTRARPFDGPASRRALAAIDADMEAVNAAHGGALRFEQSGVHRFAVSSEDAIRADVTRISVLSSIGVVLLFLILFRSLRHLLLGSAPLVIGGVLGLAATRLLFGQVHGLGLAFGSTLIGVAIDYVAHYMNHHALAPHPDGPWGSVRHIWPGLALGAATTVAGLAGLAWTSFPGIRELAVFTSVGIASALLVTRYLVPAWMPERPSPTRLHASIAGALGAALVALRRRKAVRWLLPAAAVLVCGLGLARLRWVDDIRVLNTLDPALVAEDERVRDRVSRMDVGRFVLAWGPDAETALQRNDAVHARLTEAREAGEVERFRSLAAILPSERTQRAVHGALRRSPELGARLRAALEAEGFVASAFEGFEAELEAPLDPLSWDELARSPVGDLARGFRLDLGDGRVAFVTMIRGADPAALEARLAGLEGARFFDQTELLEDAYGRFRERTIEMIAVGLVLVLLLVLARYRRLGPALAAFVPAVLAAATALAVVLLAGQQANLMHLVALLLVLSMGVDYGVFMVEARASDEDVGTTVTGILVACLSTVLSFGLLALSANPALRALGSITGLGVLLSFVLAPTAWLFVPRSER